MTNVSAAINESVWRRNGGNVTPAGINWTMMSTAFSSLGLLHGLRPCTLRCPHLFLKKSYATKTSGTASLFFQNMSELKFSY